MGNPSAAAQSGWLFVGAHPGATNASSGTASRAHVRSYKDMDIDFQYTHMLVCHSRI